jgi:hypothetical protein
MKANITLALFKKVPVALWALLTNVIQKLTGNAKLPNPPESLVNMQAVADAYAQAIEDATDGSKESKEIRNAMTKQVRDLLTITGNYVRTTANGDATILAGSGFEMAKQPVIVGLPAAPANLKVAMGPLSGQTIVRWKSSHGALNYKLDRCEKDPEIEANWKTVTTTSRVRYTDVGLEPFKQYFYRVSAFGSAGYGPTCAPVFGRAA